MNRFIIIAIIILSLLPVTAMAGLFGDTPDQQAKIERFIDLGILKFGKVDASGTREILILTKDGTGVFTHQHLTFEDGKNFEEILVKRGLLVEKPNTEGKQEKHLMVFNPKDKDTYVWIPVSKLKETRERIKATGKTLPSTEPAKRTTEKTLQDLNFNTSF